MIIIIVLSWVFCPIYTLKSLRPKAHVIAMHVHWEYRSYLLMDLRTGKIVKKLVDNPTVLLVLILIMGIFHYLTSKLPQCTFFTNK